MIDRAHARYGKFAITFRSSNEDKGALAGPAHALKEKLKKENAVAKSKNDERPYKAQ